MDMKSTFDDNGAEDYDPLPANRDKGHLNNIKLQTSKVPGDKKTIHFEQHKVACRRSSCRYKTITVRYMFGTKGLFSSEKERLEHFYRRKLSTSQKEIL